MVHYTVLNNTVLYSIVYYITVVYTTVLFSSLIYCIVGVGEGVSMSLRLLDGEDSCVLIGAIKRSLCANSYFSIQCFSDWNNSLLVAWRKPGGRL